MTRVAGRVLVFMLVLLCVPVITAGSALAVVDAEPPDSSMRPSDTTAVASTEAVLFQGPTHLQAATNDNDTERHRNPDEYGDDGDLDGVESWLEGYMSGQLEESAIELSEGEYELANDYLGEEYRDRFGQYVDVAGETDGNDSSESFDDARDEQEELANQTQEFRETQAEYEAAREDGDTERARELARELNSLADDIATRSDRLRGIYGHLEAETGVDLSRTNETIENVTQNISDDREAIVADELVATELRVRADDERISFTDPLVATGTVRTVDGDLIANTSLTLQVAGERQRVTTNESGAFTLEYRPITLAHTTEGVLIRYVPATDSVYLGSTTTVAVAVEQVTPDVVNLTVPETVAYDDQVSVQGTLTVNGVPVDGLSLPVVLGGQVIGDVTVTNGTFTGTVTVPAGVPAGEQSIGVERTAPDVALGSVTATETVTVRETETALAINATQGEGRDVRLTGQLTTSDGIGVADQPIQIRLAGETAATVRTGPDGTFATTMPAPGDDDSLAVVAAYDPGSANLAPTTAETTVTVLSGDGSASGGGQPGQSETPILPVWAWLFVGVGGALAVAGWWWTRRGTDETPVAPEPEAGGDEPGGDESSPATSVSASVLDQARAALEAGDADAAVQTCYAAVRQDLAKRISDGDTLTHWEFYEQYRGDHHAHEDDADPLLALTECYERATFGADTVSTTAAETMLEYATRLCERTTTGQDNGSTTPSQHSPADD